MTKHRNTKLVLVPKVSLLWYLPALVTIFAPVSRLRRAPTEPRQ